jgi:hypothetical protein
MNDKSYVTMEQHQCFACGKVYDTGNILMDTRLDRVYKDGRWQNELRKTFDRHTVTGTGMCPEHQAQLDDGFILLLGALDPKGEERSGHIAAIKEPAFAQVFNVPVPPKKVAFCEPQVIEKLQQMTGDSNEP